MIKSTPPVIPITLGPIVLTIRSLLKYKIITKAKWTFKEGKGQWTGDETDGDGFTFARGIKNSKKTYCPSWFL